ncbi:MAG TPA: ribosome biogenesis GTP-binding protein YihA/YsxC [Rhodanobacteraceae bacterium]|nr:ribosome biogenesis GTP-binding protein YihA/YsxC [Rhodanobacteraceae bacterium]
MQKNPFRDANYLTNAHRLDQLPADAGAEIAFAGRSNAGKSSALNAICDQKGLARTSKTPGRTQQLVVFTLDDAHRLIDLPGYGYAEVPDRLRAHWRGTIDAYLRSRASLRGVVLVMDARHPLREFDRVMLEFAHATGRRSLCLLTKSDKLSRGEAARVLAAVRKEMSAIAPAADALLFSSLARTGVDEARRILAGWLFGTPDPAPDPIV